MDTIEFSKIVDRAIQEIPEEFLSKLSNVEIVIEDEPDFYQEQKLKLGHGTLLFGLYEGVAQDVRGSHYSGVMPDKITIFKRPIEAVALTEAEIEQVVADTVKHEIAHHF